MKLQSLKFLHCANHGWRWKVHTTPLSTYSKEWIEVRSSLETLPIFILAPRHLAEIRLTRFQRLLSPDLRRSSLTTKRTHPVSCSYLLAANSRIGKANLSFISVGLQNFWQENTGISRRRNGLAYWGMRLANVTHSLGSQRASKTWDEIFWV